MSPPPERIDSTGQSVPDTEPFARPLRPGQIISGRYRIKELIARGGQALVYLAEQEALEREVALKVMSIYSDSANPEEEERFLSRFQLEARTLAALDHPHIVRVHDFGPIAGKAVYFAMEFINGPPMSQVMRKEEISRGEALRLIQQVIQALHYAHEHGVIHRDMKFTNVLITRDRENRRCAKVVDFGIAKVNDTADTLTQRGDILGSPHFMSPEQISGTDVDLRTDIYAVGVMLYNIVSGTYPFRANSPQGILAGHLMRPPAPFSDAAPNAPIPEGLEPIVLRCLNKDATERFDSMSELSEALAPFVEDTSPVPPQTAADYSLSNPSQGPRHSTGGHTLANSMHHKRTVANGQWALLGAVGVLILGIVGLTGFIVWLGFQDEPATRDDDTEKADSLQETTASERPSRSDTQPLGESRPKAAPIPPGSEPEVQVETEPVSGEHQETRSSRRSRRVHTPTSDAHRGQSASSSPDTEAAVQNEAVEGASDEFSIDDLEVVDPWEKP